MLIVRTLHKSAEREEYDNGCVGQGYDLTVDMTFTADNQADLIEEIKTFLGGAFVDINPCHDEPSRIDFCTCENELGEPPTCEETRRWKRGEIAMFYCVYTAFVEEIKPFTLEAA